MELIPGAGVEQAMKVQELILRGLEKGPSEGAWCLRQAHYFRTHLPAGWTRPIKRPSTPHVSWWRGGLETTPSWLSRDEHPNRFVGRNPPIRFSRP
jgi:hypothetical protein